MAVRTKLNHVAITVPVDRLRNAARREIMSFYGDVFGWTEIPSDEPGDPLVIKVGEPAQFVFVQCEDGTGTRAAPEDHFGVAVDSEDELDAILAKAREFQENDDRVEIVDKARRCTPGSEVDYETVNCYIAYVLPLRVEVQAVRVIPKRF